LGYELDVIRGDVATGEDDDVELTEFSDEISWVIEEFAKIGLDTAKVF
jgi:N utilization substance protein A